MSTNLLPEETQVASANKKPLAWMLVFVTGLLATVTTMYFKAVSTNRSDCLIERSDCKKDNQALRLQVDRLYAMMLKQDQDYQQLKHNTDSVLRNAVFKKQNNKNK